MYKHTVSVPRITEACRLKLDKELPGLSLIASIPLVRTKEEAVSVATNQVNRALPRMDCISATETVTETETGWTITFRILD